MKSKNPVHKSFLLLVCLFSVLTAQAQYKIEGNITDIQRNPVEDAMILILNANDSSFSQTTLTDAQGHFSLLTDDLKNKVLQVKAIGYEENFTIISATAPATQLFDLQLKAQPNSLSEVLITDNKKIFERKMDRIVFHVNADITTNGNSALDVVKKSPGVIVRQSDNSISLAGKGSVGILINDRLLQLSQEDLIAYLLAIPAENIDRIEVITSPPAKYDASGNSGLINIVLKKQHKDGMHGNIRMGYERASYGKGIVGGDFNYRKNDLNVYANVNYTNGANRINERLATLYPGQLFKVHDDYKKIMKPRQYTLGAEYSISKKSTLGLQWSNTLTNRRDLSNSSIEVFHLPLLHLDSTMLTSGGNVTKNSNNLVNLNYTFNIDSSGKKLSFDANGLWFSGNRTNNFETIHYYDAYITPTGNNSKNQAGGAQQIDIKTVQADLEMPYKWATLSMGGKLSFVSNGSNNTFGYIDTAGYHEEPAISNSFDYNEKVQAVYVSAQKTLEKWSFQAGLRGEFTHITGYSKNLNQTNTNRYFNLFPTAFIQYQWNDDNVWNINYSERINRPGYRALDPYRSYATPYHYNEGNPFLKPSFNHNLELSYTYKSRYSLSAFCQYEKDHFASVWMIDAKQNITSGTILNFADVLSFGLNAMASVTPFGWWDAQIQSGLQHQNLQSKIYSAADRSYKNLSYYIGVNNAFRLNKSGTFLAEINFYYLSKFRDDFLETQPAGNLDAGLKALLFDKRLSISLNGSDILASQKWRGVHVVTEQRIDNYFDTRNVRWTMQYKFGNNKIKGKRERSLGVEAERERM